MTAVATRDETTTPAKRRRRQRNERFLDSAALLEEAGPPRLAGQAIWLIAALVTGALIWAMVTEVDEAAVVQGAVIPAGSIRLVQHLEGGIVKEIPVEEDQVVERGQVVLRLDEARARADLDQMRIREVALALKAERLRAFVEGRLPDFAAYAARYPELAAGQHDILEQQNESQASQRAVLLSQISERKAELKGQQEWRKTLTRHLALIEEELGMRKKLLDKGLMSRIVYLDVQREANRTHGELIGLDSAVARARDAIQVAKGRLLEMESQRRTEAVTELGTVAAELAEVRQVLPKLLDHVDRLEIVSPVRGVVKQLAMKSIGAVVAPGQSFMEIVPIDDELVVEVQIRPQDIGHVGLGQEAMVRLSSYDFARFGGIRAELESISASTFEGEEGRSFYKGVLKLAKNHLGDDPTAMPVLPGMTVQANIKTGRRTVLQYLLAPVHRTFVAALHER